MKKQFNLFLLILFTISITHLSAQTYPEMIEVQGGTFTMGDTEMEGYEDEQPAHEVTLNTFSISKTPITVAQYRAYCKATGKSMPVTPTWGWIDNHPIVNVSWHDAVAYTDWLADKMDKNYRLPTEAEWEYAARGGNQSKGNKYAGARSLDGVGWYGENLETGSTHPVAQKRANELGIYDMIGNVREWCRDWYGLDYYANSPADNPRGPASGSYRVLRGGSWCGTASNCRVAYRNYYDPSHRYAFYGFRVVLSQ